MRSVVAEHKKNRCPEDDVFLSFARLVMQTSWGWDEYECRARAVLKIIPHPHGIPWHLKKTEPAGTDESLEKPVQRTDRKKRIIRCGICSASGHNARTCPNRPDTPTVTHTDGIERLSPGFDPNPPKVEESQEETS